MKLSRKDQTEIGDIISQLTIVSVTKNGREIWNCTGKETKTSMNEQIEGHIKSVAVKQIVAEILQYLGTVQ